MKGLTQTALSTRIVLATAGVVAATALSADGAVAATIFVNEGDPGGPGCGSIANPCRTVQEGVDAAAQGDRVEVAAGTYREQVEIDKALTLAGAGDATEIEPPEGELLDRFGAGDNRPLILVTDVPEPGVRIEALRIDGDARGDELCSFVYLGIAYLNSPGVVSDVTVTHVRNQPLNGCESGFAVYGLNDDGIIRHWTVEQSRLQDFQQNGITATGTGLFAAVHGNEITGAGPQPIAQNGIEIRAGAAGWVEDNFLSGHLCDTVAQPDCHWVPTAPSRAAGIMLNNAAASTVVGPDNQVQENDAGLVFRDSSTDGSAVTVVGNTFAGNRYDAIRVESGSLAVHNNELSGGPGERGDAALTAVPQVGEPIPKAELIGNTIYRTEAGLRAWAETGAGLPELRATFNRFWNNDRFHVENWTDADIDVENNWWGCNNFPNSLCWDIRNSGEGSVDADPWLELSLVPKRRRIRIGNRVWVRADLRRNSDGEVLDLSEFPDGTSVYFESADGIMTPYQTGTVNGTASSSFRPWRKGRLDVHASLDHQVVTTTIRVRRRR